MNWKNILHQNLLILEYPFDNKLSFDERINLFKSPNNSALEEIVKFCIKEIDLNFLLDLNKTNSDLSDKKSKINFMRKLFNWSTELISKTFKDSTFNSSIFISAKGVQVQEMLAKLTGCVIKKKIKKSQSENSRNLRYPVSCNDLQAINLSPDIIISSFNDDILREQKTYLTQLDLLTKRKKLFSDKLRSKKEHVDRIKTDINNLINELNLDSDITVDNFCDNTVQLLDWDLMTRYEESENKIKILQSKIIKFLNLCQVVQDKYEERPEEVSIKIPTISDIKDKIGSNLFLENGSLSFERAVKKVANELSFNEDKYKNDLLRKENERIMQGILLVESAISKNLVMASDMRESLMQLSGNIKEHNIVIETEKLEDFWKPISAKEFIIRTNENECDFEKEKNADNYNENQPGHLSEYESNSYTQSENISCRDREDQSFPDNSDESYVDLGFISKAEDMFLQNIGNPSDLDANFLNTSDSSIVEFMENNS